MKKKSKLLFLAGSLLFGAITLASCNISNVGSASSSSSNNSTTTTTLAPSGTNATTTTSSTTSVPITTTQGGATTTSIPTTSGVIPTNSTGTVTETSQAPEFVGFKVFIDEEEYSNTNNTVTYNFGEEYFNNIVVKAIKNDESLVALTDYDIETTVNSESRAGHYTASISYGEFDSVTINVVINSIDVQINSFEVTPKIYDGNPCDYDYETTAEVLPTIYYKEKGAEDTTYTDVEPTDAGEYVAKLVIDNGEELKTKTSEFFILGKTIAKPKSDSDSFLFTTFSTGSEQTLNIPGFDSNAFDIYKKVGEDYVKVDELTNTSGTIEFKIVLKNNNYSFEGTSEREEEYMWNIISSDIVTSVIYGGDEMTFEEFISLDLYRPVSCSFTTQSGYDAYIADYYLDHMYSISDSSYSYFVIKYNFTPIYIKKLDVMSSVIDGVLINDELYNVGDDITYCIKPTDTEVTIEFIDAKSDCYYSVDNEVRKTAQGAGPVTLTLGNHKVQLSKNLNSSSYMNICYINIVLDDPLKSMDIIRYSFYENRLFSANLDYSSSFGWSSNDTDGDFVVGLIVELNEGYEDCIVRLTDRETKKTADFVKFFNNLYTTNYYGAWSYLVLEILDGNKVIYDEQITIEDSYIMLDGAVEDDFQNRGNYENVILVNNPERQCEFKLAGSNPGGKILVNGEENYIKTYPADGVYREKITYIKELYGKDYSVEFYCNVVVSEDSKDFGTLNCKYKESENGTNYGASIYGEDYGHSNCFNSSFKLYSVENFDVTTVKAEDDNYSVTSAQIVNDDVLGVTYIVATINDGENDHVLYLLVPTDHTLGLNLGIAGDTISLYSTSTGSVSFDVDENDTVTISQVAADNYLVVNFESDVNIQITNPNGKVSNLGFDDEIEDYALNVVGTYYLTITNRKNQSKTYTIIIEDFQNLLEITVGNTSLIYESNKNNDFVIDNVNYTFKGYIGEDSKDLIDDGKIELTIGGLFALSAYSDMDFVNAISGTVLLDVLEDDDNNLYTMIYCYVYQELIPIELIFADKEVSPARLIVGEDEYDLGHDDNPGDLITMPFGVNGKMLIIDNVSDDIYLSGTDIYEDYSYSLIIFQKSDIDNNIFNTPVTLAELEQYGFLFRAHDNTLKTKIEKALYMANGFVVPFGTPENAYLTDVLTSVDDMFLILKSSYIFRVPLGEEEYYASVTFNGPMSIMMGPTYDTNAIDYKMSSYDGYTELIFNVSDELLDDSNNVSANNFKLKIYSGYNLFNKLYNDAEHTSGVSYLLSLSGDSKILLPIREDANTGEKYIEFYYDLGDEDAGSAKVRFNFVDLTK